MFIPLSIPSRKLFDMFLCSMGACVIAILTFPPQDPPPCFPMLPCWHIKENKEDN
jgi:hypothetical protein